MAECGQFRAISGQSSNTAAGPCFVDAGPSLAEIGRDWSMPTKSWPIPRQFRSKLADVGPNLVDSGPGGSRPSMTNIGAGKAESRPISAPVFGRVSG